MSGVNSWTHQKGLRRTRPDKIVFIIQVPRFGKLGKQNAQKGSLFKLLARQTGEQRKFNRHKLSSLRIMTQVKKPHSLEGSEKFEAYLTHPSHDLQFLLSHSGQATSS